MFLLVDVNFVRSWLVVVGNIIAMELRLELILEVSSREVEISVKVSGI